MVHFGLMDFDSGDEEELNLFYLVDSVLDDLAQTKESRSDIIALKTDVIDDDSKMPTAPNEFYTPDFMDHIAATFPNYDDSDRSFVSPDSSFQSTGSSYISNTSYQNVPATPTPFPATTLPDMSPSTVDPLHQSPLSHDYAYPDPSHGYETENIDSSFPFPPFQQHTDILQKAAEVVMTTDSLTAHDATYINAIDLSKFPTYTDGATNDSVSISDCSDVSKDLDDLQNYADLIHINGLTPQATDTNPTESTVTSPIHTHPPYPLYYGEDSTDENEDFLSWTRKHPESWNAKEVLDWVYYAAEKNGIDSSRLRGESFRTVSGDLLCTMGPEDFNSLDPYYGSFFYDLFRKLLGGLQFSMSSDSGSYCSASDVTTSHTVGQCQTFKTEDHHPHHHGNAMDAMPSHSAINSYAQSYPVQSTSARTYTCAYDALPSVTAPTGSTTVGGTLQSYQQGSQRDWKFENLYNYQFNLESGYQEYTTGSGSGPNVSAIRAKYENVNPVRRRPGRPRIKSIPTEEELKAQREKKLKSQHLWEFVYDLLNNPAYNPSVLKWENQSEGVFRFVKSDSVALLWGTLKGNENMTYDKLSRAMRHYYKRGILERVDGRRLVYKFSRDTLQKMLQKRALLVKAEETLIPNSYDVTL